MGELQSDFCKNLMCLISQISVHRLWHVCKWDNDFVYVLTKHAKQFFSNPDFIYFILRFFFLFVCLFYIVALHDWAGPWENVSYVICEQQRRRSACASAQSDHRLCFSLLRYDNISRFYSRNVKSLASFYGCAGWFVSGLFGNSWRHVSSCRGCTFSVCIVD